MMTNKPIITQLPIYVSKFTSADFTPTEWVEIQKPANEAAQRADEATQYAIQEARKLQGIIEEASRAVTSANEAILRANLETDKTIVATNEAYTATALATEVTIEADTAANNTTLVINEANRVISLMLEEISNSLASTTSAINAATEANKAALAANNAASKFTTTILQSYPNDRPTDKTSTINAQDLYIMLQRAIHSPAVLYDQAYYETKVKPLLGKNLLLNL